MNTEMNSVVAAYSHLLHDAAIVDLHLTIKMENFEELVNKLDILKKKHKVDSIAERAIQCIKSVINDAMIVQYAGNTSASLSFVAEQELKRAMVLLVRRSNVALDSNPTYRVAA